MKAEERKEIETNSLIHTVQKLRQRVTGRTLYYLVGTVAVIVGAFLLYRYLTGERSKTRDAGLMQFLAADTREKLKQGMEEHRGTTLGNMFKLELARDLLYDEGLPKLGTDSSEARRQAAASVEQARTYWQELTGEFKQHEQRDLLQEAWLAMAEAESALVGLPTAEGGNDSRGSADKVIEYYDNAASIFPDTEFSKRYKAHADKIRSNKEQFVATQKAVYKPRESSPGGVPPKFDDPLGSSLFPKKDSTLPKIEVPLLPPPPGGKTDVPPAPPLPTTDPKKTPDPKPAEAPKADPKAK